MRRTLVGSLVGLLLMTSSAFADDNTTTAVTPAIAAAATSLVRPDLAANITGTDVTIDGGMITTI